MKINERGQVTIPRHLREQFGLTASTEIEFVVGNAGLVLRRKDCESETRRDRIQSCAGILQGQPEDVDEFIEEIRGR